MVACRSMNMRGALGCFSGLPHCTHLRKEGYMHFSCRPRLAGVVDLSAGDGISRWQANVLHDGHLRDCAVRGTAICADPRLQHISCLNTLRSRDTPFAWGRGVVVTVFWDEVAAVTLHQGDSCVLHILPCGARWQYVSPSRSASYSLPTSDVNQSRQIEGSSNNGITSHNVSACQ